MMTPTACLLLALLLAIVYADSLTTAAPRPRARCVAPVRLGRAC